MYGKVGLQNLKWTLYIGAIYDLEDYMVYAFSEYAGRRKKLDSVLESVVYEAQANPELAKILQEAGFWGQLGSNIYQAGKQFLQGAWNQGGIKSGFDAARSTLTGPATQIGYAISTLEKAKSAIEKDPNWSKSQTTGQPGKYPSMPLVQWLADTIQELKGQQGQFSNKQLPTKDAAAAQTQAAQPAPGTTPAPADTGKSV